MNSSVSDISNCFGCGVCSMVCKRNLIDLTLNEDGFFKPIVDTLNCVNCGLCRDVCAYINVNDSFNPVVSAYGAWSNNNTVRDTCSSGGIAYEISRYLLGKEFKICAVRYNPEKNIAEHYISECIEDLEESKGSKYIQSYTVDAFRKINLNDKYLIVGTPCQISSIRRVIRRFNKESNFILIDFFCHGVPSKFMWDKYLNSIVKSVGNIIKVCWRNKANGWHDSWVLKITGSKGEIESFWTQGDKFFSLYLSDSCLNKACYDSCRFKNMHSYADIRIGDAWGRTYCDNEDGVSIGIAFTSIGDSIIRECGCHLESREVEELTEVQMKTCPQRPELYQKIISRVKDDKSSIDNLYNIIWRSKIYKKFKYRVRRIVDILKTPLRRT